MDRNKISGGAKGRVRRRACLEGAGLKSRDGMLSGEVREVKGERTRVNERMVRKDWVE